MKSNKNIDIVREFFDKQTNESDISSYEKIVSTEVAIHGPGTLQKTVGINHAKHIDRNYLQKYPGKEFKIEEIFPYKDKVYVRWNCAGRQNKDLRTGASKEASFSITGLSIFQISGDKIIQIWQFWDRLCILEQLAEEPIQTESELSNHYFDLLKGLGMGRCFKDLPLLSKRERQCLRALLVGETAKEVALEYGLSYRTIESYYENLKNKLNCQSKRDLLKAAQALDKLQLI